MERSELIRTLASAKVTNTLGNTTRGWRQKLSLTGLEDEIIDTTAYLSASCDLSERLLNIRLGITKLPRCELCQASLEGQIWMSKLCYRRFCSKSCHHAYVTEKRVDTMTAKGSKIAKAAAAKSVATQRSNGSLERRIIAALNTKRATGKCVPEDQIPEHRRYKQAVRKITSQQPVHLLPNFEKRGFTGAGGWHIDHRYSISEGFKNNIPPEIIGNIANLTMLPGALNVKKQGGCSITLEELRLLTHDLQSWQQVFPATSCDHQLAHH